MTLELKPYVGVGQLMFGMTEEDVKSIIGPPIRQSKNSRNETKYRYSEFVLVFSQVGGLAEITFEPGASLLVGGIDLFHVKWPLQQLTTVDSQPLESVGILLFPKLGITLSGFHTEDPKTVTAICSGRLDHLLAKFSPYNIRQAKR